MTAEARIPGLMTWVNWIKPFSSTLMDKQTLLVFKTKDVSFLMNTLSLSHTHMEISFASNLQIQKEGLSFLPSRSFFVRLGDSLCLVTHQKHVWLIRICSSFVLPLTRSLHRREGQKNGVDVSVSKKEKENENFLSLHLFIFL